MRLTPDAAGKYILYDIQTGAECVFDWPVDAKEAIDLGFCVLSKDAERHGFLLHSPPVDSAKEEPPKEPQKTSGPLPSSEPMKGRFNPDVASREELFFFVRHHGDSPGSNTGTEVLRDRSRQIIAAIRKRRDEQSKSS